MILFANCFCYTGGTNFTTTSSILKSGRIFDQVFIGAAISFPLLGNNISVYSSLLLLIVKIINIKSVGSHAVKAWHTVCEKQFAPRAASSCSQKTRPGSDILP